MERAVLDMLKALRRKLLVANMATAALQSLAAAAAGAAMLEISHALAYPHRPYAWLVAALTIFAGAALLVGPKRLRQGHPIAGGVLVVMGTLAAAVLWLGLEGAFGRLAIPAVALPAAVLAGALAAMLRRPTIHQAAAWLDARLALKERLTMAAQLLDAPSRHASPLDALVLRQATEALSQSRVTVWNVSDGWRRRLAMCGLTALLAAAMLALPQTGPHQAADEVARLAGQVDQMAASQQAQLASKLQQAAQAKDGAARELLNAAALAAQAGETENFKKALAHLERAVREGSIKLAKVPGMSLPQQRVADVVGNSPPQQQSSPPAGMEGAAGSAAGKLVFVPASSSGPQGLSAQASDGTAAWVAMDEAWQDALRQATDDLASGSVPPEHRQMVRKFFSNN